MKTSANVLVVDDEPVIRDTVAEFLQQEGFGVAACGTGEEAIELAGRQKFDVALCDVNLPGLDGIEVLERLTKISPETFVVLITAYATVETAVEAFQKGAHDYLMKPIILHEVLGKIRRLLKQRDLFLENQWLRRELNRDAETGEMVVGRSPAMRQAMELARKVGPTPSTVLILGESGTGKELLARAVHRFAQAARPTDGRFLAVNCAAIPADLLENQLFGHRKGAFTGADRDSAGVFAHAGQGTVFLDEIGELPLGTQAKLLRAIEQKEVFPVGANEPVRVDARILAATNKDLGREAAEGRFREDLYYRLNVVSIRLPPLRERREDLPDLVEFLLAKQARSIGKKVAGVSHEAMQLLLAHPWKGNVRELDNALQRAVILGDGPLVMPGDLPPDIAPQPADPSTVDDLGTAVERFERLHIERILRQTPDKREAAKRLGIGLSSLYRKIEQYGIAADR
ncbi:MAG TPA: sigma-54 dependent transcriptional regulator [Fimbriiglobus sp.]|nr:sigma-54 dependent transcriptional regulator [Fimbriiglobus sp.]